MPSMLNTIVVTSLNQTTTFTFKIQFDVGIGLARRVLGGDSVRAAVGLGDVTETESQPVVDAIG